MSDFLHANTDGIPDDDMNRITQIASRYVQQGESVLEIRAIGIDKVQIDVGIIINKKAGSGRKIAVERVAGNWTVTDVQGWIA